MCATKSIDVFIKDDVKLPNVDILKVVYWWKHGDLPKGDTNKPQLLAAWNRTKNSPIVDADKMIMTTHDQSNLERLDLEAIYLCNT